MLQLPYRSGVSRGSFRASQHVTCRRPDWLPICATHSLCVHRTDAERTKSLRREKDDGASEVGRIPVARAASGFRERVTGGSSEAGMEFMDGLWETDLETFLYYCPSKSSRGARIS